MRRLLLFITVIGAAFLFTACGSEESTASESDSDVRTIDVAVPPANKPLSYTANGELTGYEVEILKAIDEKLPEYEFNIVGVKDSAAEIGLDTGKYDLIAQGLFLTDDRKEKYLYPTENNGYSLIRIYANQENKDIETLEDLVGKNISPPQAPGGIFNFLTEYNEENPDKQIEFKTTDAGISAADKLKEVDQGKYDAIVLPNNLGQDEIIEKAGLDLHVSDPIAVIPTYFMIHKTEENEALNEAVSQALKELKEEGVLKELSIEFYGEDIFQYE